MPEITELEQQIGLASGLYHRSIFLVGSSSDERSGVLAQLSQAHGWSVVNLGLRFSERLIEIPRRHRATRVPDVLADVLGGRNGDVLLVDRIEVLFTPELVQDPVRLLQGLSRNRTLVVSWPGERAGNVLLYAEAGHPEHYREQVTDLLHVDLGNGHAATQPH